VFANEMRRRFYHTLTARLHDAGNLRFFYLKLDGRIVAQEYCFQHDGTVYLLQEGFDFSLAKENIGNALRSYVFEYLIENGYKVYDFLGGVTRHKLNWSDGIARDVTFTIARPTLRGALAFQIPVAVERGKALLRPLRDSLRKPFSGGPGAPVPGRDMD
jgi:CelD/BcsL family acetyltransferase involved in cellulose biosynthesis